MLGRGNLGIVLNDLRVSACAQRAAAQARIEETGQGMCREPDGTQESCLLPLGAQWYAQPTSPSQGLMLWARLPDGNKNQALRCTSRRTGVLGPRCVSGQMEGH